MVLSLLEIVAYGVIGYGTLLFVISMIARKDLPEVPVQAGLRAALCVPGMVALEFMAFSVAGHDATDVEDRRFFTVTKYQATDDMPLTYFYDKIPVEISTRVTTYYSENYGPPIQGDPPLALRNGSFGTTFERQEIELDEPGMWIISHTLFIGAILVWIIYQFAIMFQLIFARKPGA